MFKKEKVQEKAYSKTQLSLINTMQVIKEENEKLEEEVLTNNEYIEAITNQLYMMQQQIEYYELINADKELILEKNKQMFEQLDYLLNQ
jgi:hypothetical protein